LIRVTFVNCLNRCSDSGCHRPPRIRFFRLPPSLVQYMAYFGYSLWLVGVDAPTAQKTYFKMSKSSKEKYSSVCLDILCSHIKCCGIKTFFVTGVREENFVCNKIEFHGTFFCLLIHRLQKTVFPTVKPHRGGQGSVPRA
jgi:hypothetical protein